VVKLAQETVGHAQGMSVSLERHGELPTVAASNDTVLEMDHHQYESGEGPCVAAAAQGHEPTSRRWLKRHRGRRLLPKPSKGIKSILSTPLVAHDRPLGAINIYFDAELAIGANEQELAQLFATQTEGLLGVAGAAAPDEHRRARMVDALRSRDRIAVAIGVLMERDGATQRRSGGSSPHGCTRARRRHA
jgi:hypothetical protein